ncbi:hypothetical protein GALMADRAFT_66474 [Galerina marginata CBS 339.88]|uniref:Phosphatidylglycerol lysyltransferase C-terminal domain-containing protein n=1 Tax=Galerina marginata (strain CBS 339.88) TaxID=685588 RepID=A0A067T272_GALM3|nr:hypothetical protein GALMADRAFT_66474 [Galerina marginata CBS 339.88]
MNECPTGCVFGSHDHAAHRELEAASREHLATPPPGIFTSSSPAYKREEIPVPDLIARYGNSSATAWLDSHRYKIWRPSQPIPESEFTPVQGYIQKDPFIFAWGNPLVSSPRALEKTARAFIAFAEASHLHPIWSCVDHDLETVLAGFALGWVTVSCIFEEVMDPAHVLDLANSEHAADVIGDLAKNLHSAEIEHVEVDEVKKGGWNEKDREGVEKGIKEWKAHKHGMELKTMTLNPWTDEPHRRYWVAKRHHKVLGVAILSQTSPMSWQIVNCLTFRHAAHGTSETLVYTALKDLYTEREEHIRTATPASPVVEPRTDARSPDSEENAPEAQLNRTTNRLSVTFGIAASDHLEPGHNLSGWKVNVLSKTYHAVSGVMSLNHTVEFTKEFGTEREPMYVCYPANGFGFMAIGALIIALRK